MVRRKATVNKRSRPGRLRIVAGKWRSRLLPVVDLPGLRPTSERVRETLFNWLSSTISGKRCLDLFAGTGALGFEALSRGAGSVTLVEQSRQAADGLRDCVQTLAADDARIECADALSFLRAGTVTGYDLVFLDPPFADDLLEECCRMLQSKAWLKPNATIYIEQDKRQPSAPLPDGWQVEKEKTAGNVRYALIRVDDVGEGRSSS